MVLVKKKKICMIDIGDWNWMFLVQMNQLWLMSNINPFQCKQYIVTVAAGAFTRLVRKSFLF